MIDFSSPGTELLSSWLFGERPSGHPSVRTQNYGNVIRSSGNPQIIQFNGNPPNTTTTDTDRNHSCAS